MLVAIEHTHSAMGACRISLCLPICVAWNLCTALQQLLAPESLPDIWVIIDLLPLRDHKQTLPRQVHEEHLADAVP